MTAVGIVKSSIIMTEVRDVLVYAYMTKGKGEKIREKEWVLTADSRLCIHKCTEKQLPNGNRRIFAFLSAINAKKISEKTWLLTNDRSDKMRAAYT